MTASSEGDAAAIQNSPPALPVPAGTDPEMESISMKRGKLLTLAVLLAFAVFLLWSTLSSQRVECTVTVAFGQGQNTASASANSEQDALREAQTAACGPLAQGMDESIACGKVPPISRQCRGL